MRGPDLPLVAVIGCGYWGRNLVRNFAELGALSAVVDAAPALAAELAQRHDVPARDWSAVLADPDIDAVVLATPAERHAAMALEALGHGKHVFVEKPLALSVADGERVAAAAAAARRTVMVGHLLQYHPAFLKLVELVRAGELGRLQYLYSNRLNLGRIRREENVFWSFAPHDLSMILALAGEPPTRVSAVGCSYLHPSIADVTTTHLEFANGINAHVFVSWLHPSKEQKLVVVGDAGMAVFDDGQPWDRKLTLFRHRIAWRNGSPEPAKAAAEPVPLDAGRAAGRGMCRTSSTASPPASGRAPMRPRGSRCSASSPPRRRRCEPPVRRRLSRPRIWPARSCMKSAFVDPGCELGEGTRIWHFSHVLGGVRIGRHCVIGQNAMIGPDVSVGNHCKIQNNVSLYRGVTLEDGVFCGPSCVFTNVLNPRAEVERKDEFRATLVRRGATIGANATIICGRTLGEYCFVAAGAVVTRDVPAFALVAGNPARRIGWVSRSGERLGPDLVCPRTGERYHEIEPDRLVAEG